MYQVMSQDSIPPVGVREQEKRCHVNFRVSGIMSEFDMNSGDVGNRRDIDLFVLERQQLVWRPVVYNNIRLTAKYCTQIPEISLKTFRYVCAIKHIYCQISHG